MVSLNLGNLEFGPLTDEIHAFIDRFWVRNLSKIVEWAGNPFNIKIVRSKYETVFLGFIHIFAMLDATFRKKILFGNLRSRPFARPTID